MNIIQPNHREWIDVFRHTIENGGVVIFPSDSSYGIAVDATNETAIEKVFALKQRDKKPLSIIVHNEKQAKLYADFSSTTQDIWDRYMPGPVTLIMYKTNTVPFELTRGHDTIGIRYPKFDITYKMSLTLDVPYTATSANLSGHPPCYNIKDVLQQLDESMIDLIIDAGQLPPNLASTVIDTTVDPPVVLRKGPVALPSF